jgi:hypothetical protein
MTVTFVFPRDFKTHDHQPFAERLGARHRDVSADYWWGASLRQAPPSQRRPMRRWCAYPSAARLYADLVARNRSPAKVPGLTITVDDSAEGRQARQWLKLAQTRPLRGSWAGRRP